MASLRFSSLRPKPLVPGSTRHGFLGSYIAPRAPRQRLYSQPTLSPRPYSYRRLPYSTHAAEHSIAPPKPALLRRILTVCALGIVFTAAGFTMAASPAIASINGMLTPPSDSETLSLFTASDPQTAQIDAFIKSHPLAQQLRENPDFIESRPHLKIPADIRTHSFSAGTLTGSGRIWVPPTTFAHKDGDEMYQLAYLGKDLSGHPGVVHGGCIATLVDEGFARCCFPKLPNRIGMTASLSIDYKAPLPTDSYVVLKAKTVKVEGRKAWVEGTLETLVPPGEQGTVHAAGKALFVEPRQAATMARLYPVAR